MLSTKLRRIRQAPISLPTTWLIGACMEARGKQDLWLRQKPEVLAALREQAIVQSAESSNRIEGVTVASNRLRPILLGKSRPQDRSEEELVGYRKALNWIFSRKREIRVEPETLLFLHETAQGGFSWDAGKWKQRDNEIVEFSKSGERKIRFVPTPAKDVPATVRELCRSYADLSHEDGVPILLTLSSVVFDFLCIHPFRDGNGRVSRLLTTLLLQNHGFVVGRYVSLERLVEETKTDYYEVLGRCSVGWHEGKNEMTPWWNYLLGLIRRAYAEFERRVEGAEYVGKGELIRQTICRQTDDFSLAEIQAQCSFAGLPIIKKVLAQMKESRQVCVVGRGRGARWKLKRK